MLDLAVSRLTRATRDWFVDSPLGSSADAYVQYLLSRGYAAASIRSYVVSVAHFSHWLAGHHYGLDDLSETLVNRFLDQHLPACQCAPRLPHMHYCVRPALVHLLRLLRAGQKIAPKTSADPATIVTDLRDFERHLTDVRGLSPTTRYARLKRVRAFLLDIFGARPIRLDQLRRAHIVGFMARYTAHWKPSSKQCVASSLRSYFRFKSISGEPTSTLSAALPRIAQWRLSTLPKSLSPLELARLMVSVRSGHLDSAVIDLIGELIVFEGA
jgi:site-specific recombinase XerD